VLVHHPIGQKLIAASICLGLVGMLWIRKLLRIEV
jgi:Flp pilus assembly protein TadB